MYRPSSESKPTIERFYWPELINVHQQLEDAKSLSEVRGKKLFGAQVDTLSISKVGAKVTALNKDIFQAAATLGEALIHKRRELSKKDLDAAVAVSQEMVGKKMTNFLINQSQDPELKINPLLVQVVLQIFMVKFCVSKIQSWFPDNSFAGGFLSALYSGIRSTGEHRIDLKKPSFCLTYNNLQRNKRYQVDGVLLLDSIPDPALKHGERSFSRNLSLF